MVVGVLHLSLAIPEAASLKDKRRVLKSLKDRLAHRHNISVAEVGDLDDHRRSTMAVALVSNDRRFTESCLAKIANEVRTNRGVVVIDSDIELW